MSERPARRRAVKACVSCRERKVRCDVTVRGPPCVNCYLDDKRCVVAERRSRRRLPTYSDVGVVSEACGPASRVAGTTSNHTGPASDAGVTAGDSLHQRHIQGHELHLAEDSQRDLSPSQSLEPGPCTPWKETEADEVGPLGRRLLTDFFVGTRPPKLSLGNKGTGVDDAPEANVLTSLLSPLTVSRQRPASLHSNFVPFSDFKFINPEHVAKLPREDLDFLERKGCLHLPPKIILDELLRLYFFYVNPFLPFLDEGDFWDTYCPVSRQGTSNARLSLLLIQAMLFAASGFGAQPTIEALGFKTISSARAAFYHRAKMLYDFEIEPSFVVLSQAALLFTSWSPPDMVGFNMPVPNTLWLSIAIHHAKCSGADDACLTTPPMTSENPGQRPQAKHARMLRRLWWCCLIRDRILSLGLRRRLQVTESYPALSFDDFESELDQSEVMNADNKRRLVRILLNVMDLLVRLTEFLRQVPLSDCHRSNLDQKGITTKLANCRSSLRTWFLTAGLDVPTLQQCNEFQNHSVIVHTSLMYMYYYCAQFALPHQEALLNTLSSQPGTAMTSTPEGFLRSHDVQEAACGITEILEQLAQLGLVQYLPPSALAFTAFPLLLSVLDLKKPLATDLPDKWAAKKHRFQVLVDAMSIYESRYYGVEFVSATIRHVVDSADLEPCVVSNGLIKDWADLLVWQPTAYLRRTLTMELTLSSAKIPCEDDFPSVLRGDHSACASPNGSQSSAASAGSQGTGGANDAGSSVSMPQGQTDTENTPLSTTGRPEETSHETENAPGGNFSLPQHDDAADDHGVVPMEEYADLISLALMVSSPPHNPESADAQSAPEPTTVGDSTVQEVTASLSHGHDDEIDWTQFAIRPE